MIRNLLFIPIVFLIIVIINALLPLALHGLMNLSSTWIIILLIFYGGLAVLTFQLLPGVITWLAVKLAPDKQFAYYVTFIASIIAAAAFVYYYWSNPDLILNGVGVFLRLTLTCLTIGLSTSCIMGSGMRVLDEKALSLSYVFTIGTFLFYIGIFLVFCLLSIKVCYINPDKLYTWYSGIWHGIFAIPHWIVSWFSSDIYCKAPNATMAYNIWWWICAIFTGISILGGGSSRG
jgi:hypothetical protein